MASFSPPTYQVPFDRTRRDRLMSRVTYPKGRLVFYPDPQYGGVTAFPGRTVIRSDLLEVAQASGARIWQGGFTYPITLEELARLIAAGYGAHITVEAPSAPTTVGLAAEAAVTS